MIETHYVLSDRNSFQVIPGVGFENKINEEFTDELFIQSLHKKLDKWIDQFIETEEVAC